MYLWWKRERERKKSATMKSIRSLSHIRIWYQKVWSNDFQEYTSVVYQHDSTVYWVEVCYIVGSLFVNLFNVIVKTYLEILILEFFSSILPYSSLQPSNNARLHRLIFAFMIFKNGKKKVNMKKKKRKNVYLYEVIRQFCTIYRRYC